MKDNRGAAKPIAGVAIVIEHTFDVAGTQPAPRSSDVVSLRSASSVAFGPDQGHVTKVLFADAVSGVVLAIEGGAPPHLREQALEVPLLHLQHGLAGLRRQSFRRRVA
jgi:hypothetical protein